MGKYKYQSGIRTWADEASQIKLQLRFDDELSSSLRHKDDGDGKQSHPTLVLALSQFQPIQYFLTILVDPARGYCYRGPTKPCESNVAIHGGLLSNTWTTYPWDWDKPGKLGIIPDSSRFLE